MADTQQVLEYSKPSVRENVIRGVKILGRQSAHGWTYPADVLHKAISLYESAPVFISHPDRREKRQGSRRLRDHFGNLENIDGLGDGLYGDLTVKLSHPLAREILEQAPSATFGLSHNAVVRMTKDRKQVAEIVEVNSVDLVDDPATNRNLFEEHTMPDKNDDGKPDPPTFEERMVGVLEKMEALLVAPKPTDKLVTEGKPAPKRLTQLEDNREGEDEGNGEPIGNSHEAFLGVVRGFSLE